jgi:hypothetical protein
VYKRKDTLSQALLERISNQKEEEEAMSHNHKYQSKPSQEYVSILKLVKWTFLPYLGLNLVHFLVLLGRNPTNPLKALIFFIELSGWGYLIVGGPFILIGVGINYFMNLTTLTNIPPETTLYEAITQSTMMVGNVKVILPKLEEEPEVLEVTERGKD